MQQQERSKPSACQVKGKARSLARSAASLAYEKSSNEPSSGSE